MFIRKDKLVWRGGSKLLGLGGQFNEFALQCCCAARKMNRKKRTIGFSLPVPFLTTAITLYVAVFFTAPPTEPAHTLFKDLERIWRMTRKRKQDHLPKKKRSSWTAAAAAHNIGPIYIFF